MPKKFFYLVECAVEKCDAEVYLNDVPVVIRGEAHGYDYRGQANELIRPGENVLSLVINPGPRPSQALTGPGGRRRRTLAAFGASAQASIVRYPFGAIAGGPEGEELLRVSWRGDDDDEPRVFPRVASGRADLGAAFGPWGFEQTPRLRLDAELEAEVEAFLAGLHQSLAQGDPEPFISQSDVRLGDVARAYSQAPGKKAAQIRMLTEMDSKKQGWGLQPLEPSEWDLRLCARGRLVECVTRSWSPILKETPDEQGTYSSYSMLLGKVDGDWKIVR